MSRRRLTKDQRQALSDFEWLLQQAPGRRFVAGLLAHSGTFAQGEGGTPDRVMYAAGRRSIGVQYLGLVVSHWPGLLAALLTENLQVSDEPGEPLSDDEFGG